jgi:hypothetical protein
MKKSAKANGPGIRQEYDFSGGVRGKYVRRYKEGTNVVVLDPDVVRMFPDAATVNSSLRALGKIIRRQRSVTSK